MKLGKAVMIRFIIFQVLFFIPVIISVLTIAIQVKASVSVSELLGFTKEPYDFMSKFNMNAEDVDIIEFFADPERIPEGFHDEQEREMLRDNDYPVPGYFYASVILLVIYAASYLFLVSKLHGPFIYRWLPMLATITISAYLLYSYAGNYMVLTNTSEYYLYRVLESVGL
ncbi:hypothetical protein ACFO9Q_11220 [Paenibacillus sp. GCM10023252]|uniref:hypothetical protein n=1 Tax=Paenibacillus sp. GCM10023252 TaxID=3252649 RepID=UPI00361E018C